MALKWWIAAALLALPQMAAAQNQDSPYQAPQYQAARLIKPAVYGTVREVEGAKLPVAMARNGCPVSAQPKGGGPCFDKLMLKLSAVPVRVLGLYVPARDGDRVSGRYGGDFALFDIRLDGKALVAERLDLPTSAVAVPRDCYALRDEDVGYAIEADKEAGLVAYESQVVVCGGGPDHPAGPYRPEGTAIASGDGPSWHRTESQQAWGQARYLANTGGPCDPQYSLRISWCAEPAVRYLQTHPDLKELDLVAARQPARAGDVLNEKQVDQWVLKRKGDRKFKADSRWSDKSYLSAEPGCTPVEAVSWHITQQSDGLYVTEGALHACGAPAAPVPMAIYEAYGDDFFIVDCAERRGWRDHEAQSKGNCFDQAGDYLRHERRKSATVLVLNARGRVDDHLYPGGYISYDVAEVSLNDDGSVNARRTDYYSGNVSMSNCQAVTDGPVESKGFVLVRSMGVTWAQAYQWMNCPVY